MGNLFNQVPRNKHVPSLYDCADSVMNDIEEMVEIRGITPKFAIEIFKLAQAHRELITHINDLDAKDEQLGGFGKLIREFIVTREEANSLEQEKYSQETER